MSKFHLIYSPKYEHLYLGQNDSKLRELDETIVMFRKLQVLTTEYNSVAFRMTVGVKAAAFWSHLGTNYGAIRLFNSMKFQIWINCPLVSICGTAVISQLFKLLAWVNVEGDECLCAMKREMCKVPWENRRYFLLTKKLLKSLRSLKVKGHHFYYFKRTTPVTFNKQLTDNTINVLLTF